MTTDEKFYQEKVEQHGSISAAARALGIHRETLSKYLGNWRPEKKEKGPEYYKNAVLQHGSMAAAARELKIAESTISRKLGDWRPTHENVPAEERSLRNRLEDRIRSLEAELRKRDQQELTAEKIGNYYFNLKNRVVEEPAWLIKPGKIEGIAGVPVVHWSDWHYGEVVDPAQVEFANAFNMKVFELRYKTLVERTIDLCFNHMTGAKYPGIVVNLGGDMLSGNIHEELALTNELETMPAVFKLSGELAWGLRQLADKFGRVFVTAVPGNHGRNTKRPQAKNACYTSFDWMIYKILEERFDEDDRFQFKIPNGFDSYYKVYGHRILLTHGDRIGSRGGDGFIGAIGPIVRGANKLRLSYAQRGREVDTVIMGHWHNELLLPGLRVNNTLKGYDEWAMSMRFNPSPPSQDLFFIHPKRGVTCSWPVQLEKPQFGQDNPNWVSWSE